MNLERYNFSDIFQQNLDGSLSPKVTINVNGIQIGPGTTFAPGASFAGIDFFKFKNRPIAIEKIGDIFHVRGFYQN